MKNKLSFPLVYFLTRSLFLGLTYSKIFNFTNEDSIIACIIGTIIGAFILKNLYNIDYQNKYNKIILFILYLFFIYLGLMNIEYFISTFYLTNTPIILIGLPIILISLYATFKSNKTLHNTAIILCIISVIVIFINFCLLFNNFNYNNLLPLLNTNFINIIKASLVFAMASSMPNILIINNKKLFKLHLKYYLITCFISLIIALSILLTLSSYVAKIYSFPEYMVLKNIKFLNFIENIENIQSIIFYFDTFILLTISFKKIFCKIKNKYLFIIFISILAIIYSLKIINYYYILLFIYNYLYIILILFFILLHKKKLFISNGKYK